VNTEGNQASEVSTASTRRADVRKIRVLWIGLGLYFLITLNALRYAREVPYQILILGALVNMAIVMAIIISMRRVYKRLAK
jgi:hypothetical protein